MCSGAILSSNLRCHSADILSSVPQNMATKEVPSISLDVQGPPQQQQQPVPYKLYKRRWPILFIFVLYSMSNAMQWTQYAIINDIITRFYGVDSYAVSWTSMIYMVTYLVLIVPGSWFLDKKVFNNNDKNNIY